MAIEESCPVAKMERVIVATDGSEFSEGAVREAIAWSKQNGSTLYAVCTAQVTLGQLEYAADVVSAIDKKARQACDTVKDRAQGENVNCETVVHEGEEPYEHIVSEAEKLGADAIVLGRRGRRGLMKLLMGSVTHLVIGHAPCDVFVVPRAGKLAAKYLLVATDGSESSEKAGRKAISLAKRTKGKLLICSVVHDGVDEEAAEKYVNDIKTIANAENINAETAICHGTAYHEIINTAKDHKVDTIVMGTHGRTGVKKVMMGSVTERVVGIAEQTIMVVQ